MMFALDIKFVHSLTKVHLIADVRVKFPAVKFILLFFSRIESFQRCATETMNILQKRAVKVLKDALENGEVAVNSGECCMSIRTTATAYVSISALDVTDFHIDTMVKKAEGLFMPR